MGKISFENTYVDVAPGASDIYKVEIVHAEAAQTQRGSDRIRMKAKILAGIRTGEDHKHCTLREGFNLPNTGDHDMDEMMSRMWMSFFVSVGYSQDEIRSKGFDFDNVAKKGAFERLLGRTGYVKYTPADPDSGQKWDKKAWLTERQWAALETAVEETSSAPSEEDPLSAILGS
jgi:hypothetical protein